jgi:hypothetical protein
MPVKYLLEVLGNNTSYDQTPDEINSLGRVLGIPVSTNVVGKVLVTEAPPTMTFTFSLITAWFKAAMTLGIPIGRNRHALRRLRYEV